MMVCFMLMLTCNSIFTYQLANTMLNEKQRDGLGSANDGFYESKREWLGRRHFILAFERYISVFVMCSCFLDLRF